MSPEPQLSGEGLICCWWALILHRFFSCPTSLHWAGVAGEGGSPYQGTEAGSPGACPETHRSMWESQDWIPGCLDSKTVPAVPLLCTPQPIRGTHCLNEPWALLE